MCTGKLGLYPHKKVHIEVESNTIPVHKRPYAVLNIYLEIFEKELDYLVASGVLFTAGMSKWVSPTFIISKKDGGVRWVSDLRTLNQVVVRRKYLLPIIKDILKKCTGYSFFSS